MTRARAKVDGNQNEIVRQLREMGVSVHSTAPLGRGFPDIICGTRKKNFLFEIKDPAQPPSKRRLTDDEQAWHQLWDGQVHVIETWMDAWDVIHA